MIKFSIITVSLNAGQALFDTVNSVKKQEYESWELIIKDGMSSDGSINDSCLLSEKIKIIQRPDSGIYDAMNQALPYISGDYVIFLNCGDWLYDSKVLSDVAEKIQEVGKHGILYGDIYIRSRGGVCSNSKIKSDYRLMSHTICHQSIFFDSSMFKNQHYDIENYRFAADMDFYVNQIKRNKISTYYFNRVICSYDGSGVSSSSVARKTVIFEKKRIFHKYFSPRERGVVIFLKIMRLDYLKEFLASHSLFETSYERLAKMFGVRRR